MKIIGELQTARYKLTLMVDTPPQSYAPYETQWLYIGKQQGGKPERQSVGIGMSAIDGLMALLNEASNQYQGPRKEFRAKSMNKELRTESREQLKSL